MKHKLMSLIFVVVVSIFSCNIGTYPGVDQEVIAALKKKGMTAKKALGDSHEISLSRCHGGGTDHCPSALNGIRLLGVSHFVYHTPQETRCVLGVGGLSGGCVGQWVVCVWGGGGVEWSGVERVLTPTLTLSLSPSLPLSLPLPLSLSFSLSLSLSLSVCPCVCARSMG